MSRSCYILRMARHDKAPKAARLLLREGWFTKSLVGNPSEPGLYEWRLKCDCVYIGKYKSQSRPMTRYALRVKQLEYNLYYNLKRADGFRNIHRALWSAYKLPQPGVILTILKNPPLSEIDDEERRLISERGCLNMPPYYGGPMRCTCAIHHSIPANDGQRAPADQSVSQ